MSDKIKIPICYKTGDWDGKMSDLCLCQDEKDEYHLARCYEYENGGFEWYDKDDFGLMNEVVKWTLVDKIQSLEKQLALAQTIKGMGQPIRKLLVEEQAKKIKDQETEIQSLEAESNASDANWLKKWRELEASERELKAENQKLKELLKIAKCPNCDGSGAIQTKVIRSGSRQISETEFEEVPVEDFDIEPCQWCDERKKITLSEG